MIARVASWLAGAGERAEKSDESLVPVVLQLEKSLKSMMEEVRLNRVALAESSQDPVSGRFRNPGDQREAERLDAMLMDADKALRRAERLLRR